MDSEKVQKLPDRPPYSTARRGPSHPERKLLFSSKTGILILGTVAILGETTLCLGRGPSCAWGDV